jgi:hypothetical protein
MEGPGLQNKKGLICVKSPFYILGAAEIFFEFKGIFPEFFVDCNDLYRLLDGLFFKDALTVLGRRATLTITVVLITREPDVTPMTGSNYRVLVLGVGRSPAVAETSTTA